MEHLCIQNQYVFIHDALNELVNCGDTEINPINMRIVIGKLSRTVEGQNISGFQKQFEVSDSENEFGNIPKRVNIVYSCRFWRV